jgi:hypothetical protein
MIVPYPFFLTKWTKSSFYELRRIGGEMEASSGTIPYVTV